MNLWLLCVDSVGINVWCAARGGNFGNKQIIEAFRASDLKSIKSNKELILPQLAAGGVERTKLLSELPVKGFKVTYGPVWAKNLPDYLSDRPKVKPPHMKIAKFTLKHRIRAGVTHTTFLLRKIFLLPLVIMLLGALLVNSPTYWRLFVDLSSSFLIANGLISLLFPLSGFTRKFIYKGIFFGGLTLLASGLFSVFVLKNTLFTGFNLVLYFWVSFFSTMSFSGYTFATGIREIEAEYQTFTIMNRIAMIGGILLVILGIFINLI